jgi:7-carboxy-7-deazaguanine synthase
MFGQNPIRKRVTESPTFWVQEVFHTIQGEGPLTGTPAVFVRLAGCNLACWFCDTEFESSTWNPTQDEFVHKIIDVLNANPKTKLVVFTGGEPMRQPIEPVVDRLLTLGLRVQIETAGTYYSPSFDDWRGFRDLTIVCSPKTGKLATGFVADAYKYIVQAGIVSCNDDGLPVMSTQSRLRTNRLARPPAGTPVTNIYVQPCDEHNAEANAANLAHATALSLKHGYRLCIQTHKIAGVP